jgi:hypothetical protein
VPIPSTFDVRVSAGSPVAGAIVTVYAISNATGDIDTAAAPGGILGSAGPTDESGRVAVSTAPHSGLVQIVASGAALTYVDPTSPLDPSGAPAIVRVPSSFVLSSLVASFKPSPMVVPVTLLTTLADHEALAYARGLHPAHPGRMKISEALAARDPLFVGHVTKAAAAWDPGSLRTTAPATLTGGPQSLVDSALAALFDIGLNQLAHDQAALAPYGSALSGLSAPLLLQLLEADVDADGKLDGLGEGGNPVLLPAGAPRAIDSQFACLPLAVALDTWVRRTDLNKTGIGEAELIAGRVLEALVNDGSDLFGDHRLGSVDELIDHTPPVVSWAADPPAAVGTASVSLSISASDDRTGVKGVMAQVGTSAPAPATLQPDGKWVADLLLLPGPNVISAWAEDNAAVPNSGQFRPAPYQLAATVIWETSAPTVAYNSSFASYRDERGMTLAKDPGGLATVPPVYGYADPTPVAIPSSGGHVYKAASRLAWGSPPSAAVLEDPLGGNPDNIPVLQFWAPFTEGVDAPIASASYSVSLSCAGCAFADATGNLWPSATTSPGKVYFDLPLSAILIPALSVLPGPATLTVTITLIDAAGRAGVATPVSLTFHTIGDPLAISEDTAYPSQSDPRSTYPYAISNGLYSNLFNPDPAGFLPEEQVRLVRYLVSNPAPASVALALPSIPGGWSVVETWPGSPGTALGTFTYTITSMSCSAAPTCSGATPIAYWGGSAGSGCGSSPPHNVTPTTDTRVVTSGDLSTFAYVQSGGVDLAPAPRTAAGQVIVPASEGGAPGVIALYLGRPVSAPPRSYVLPWNGSAYQYVVEDAWVKVSQGVTGCCDYDPESRKCFRYDAPSTWSGTRFFRTLTAGVDALSGTFELVTNGMSASAVVGESNTVAGSETVTRNIPH